MGEQGRLNFETFIQQSRQKLDGAFSGIDLRPNDLVILLNRAAGIATGVTEAQIHRPRGLSWNAFKVLYILWTVGDLEQHRVALLAGTSRATTSALMKTLVKNHHVVQVQSKNDKRTNMLTLTECGRQVVHTAYLEQNELLTEWSERLSHTEQDILKMLLMKLMR